MSVKSRVSPLSHSSCGAQAKGRGSSRYARVRIRLAILNEVKSELWRMKAVALDRGLSFALTTCLAAGDSFSLAGQRPKGAHASRSILLSYPVVPS